jgi:small GTP-binding protein
VRPGAVPDAAANSLDELVQLAAGVAPAETLAALREARTRKAESVLNIAVLGEFKRGKSTLINALVGREVLPMGALPLTSGVTIVRAAPADRVTVRFGDGRTESAALGDLADYVTEAANPENERDVDSVTVELSAVRVTPGLQLIDTPGIASVHEHNTEATLSFLSRVDAGLCVLAADQPLTGRERDFLIEAAQFAPRLIIAVNRIDRLTPSDLDEALAFLTRALREPLGGNVELIPVSALVGTGVERLRNRLVELTEREGGSIRGESERRAGHRLAAETGRTARIEITALRLPLDDLERRSRLFEERLEDLRSAQAQAEDSLDRGLERLVADRLDEPLSHFADERFEPLRAELRVFARAVHLPQRTPFGRSLDAWVDRRVKDEFDALVPRLEHDVGEELAALERAHSGRTAAILAELQAVSRELFAADSLDAMPRPGLRAPSKFSFKLHDVRHALDQLITACRRALPGPLGRRLMLRDAEVRLRRMLDRHAGRLRGELAGRAREAVAEYERELASLVSDAATAIRGAVERAQQERARGEDQTRFRLADLERAARRSDQIALMLSGPTGSESKVGEVS